MVDWSRYLESICTAYAQWWQVYTLTDVVGQKRERQEQKPLLFDFGLMVQAVKRDEEERGEKERVERLGVLEGLRKYASEHVLLEGRPGSGKSTALARLLLEEAERGSGGVRAKKMPVLVELRYYRTSVLDLIQDFLQRHDPNLAVDAETLKTWLRQGQLLLLVDGLNELPSDEARRELQKFRQDYQQTTPMIFTTRDLGVGGDLGIAKKLEMQPLTEGQMQQFVRAYLPEQGEQMLRQLGSRLREFGQTPLLLMMLCSVFVDNRNRIPSNLGSVFRRFTQIYNNKLKQDIPTSRESRRWCPRLLEHLAWVMTCGEAKTELQVAIPRQKAEAVLTEFLAAKVAHPEDCALSWLEDLLKHHLIQLGAGEQIEFRHQLIQEYYTAESLLKLLPSLGDEDLEREYLNYLKWTEPLALMLELVEDEAQAVRVVKSALEVDWWLGARLAGAVKPEWQEQTVGLVARLTVPQLLKIQLLGITQSDRAVPQLVKALNHEHSGVRRSAAEALGNVSSDAAISELVKALNHEDFGVRRSVVEALGRIGSDAAIPGLVKALNHEDSNVRWRAVGALGKIGSDAAILELVKSLNREDSDVCRSVVEALGKIGSDAAIPELVKALNREDSDVRWSAAEALGKIGSDAAILELVKALNHEDSNVRRSAVGDLGKIGSDAAIPELVKSLNDEDSYVRRSAAEALGKIGSDAAIPELVKSLNDEDYRVRWSVVEALGKIDEALGKIDSDAAIPELAEALNHEDYRVRRSAAEALGRIGSNAAIPELVKALNDEDYYVRRSAAEALGRIGSDAAIPELVKALNDEDYLVFWSAAEALGRIGSDAAIPELVKALNREDSDVRWSAAEALGRIGSDAAIPELVKSLNREDSDVRWSAAEALGRIGSDAAIPELVKSLNHEYSNVRRSAAEALGRIGSDAAIPELVKSLNDEDSNVRRNAAEALGKISSDVAIPELVKALNDEYSDVRRSAVEALGRIGSDAAIPELVKALNDEYSDVRANHGDTLEETTEALQSVQEKLKLYNPTLSQPIPTAAQPDSPPIQPISTSLMHILHLSDFHITTPDQATLWSNQLAEDLHNDRQISHLDALILSGDIANYSTPEEYQAAQQFLHNLCQDFPLDPEQIIIVPGNHDLNWKITDWNKEEDVAYTLKPRKYCKPHELQEGCYIEESQNAVWIRDDEKYKQRFANFSHFYQTIKGNPYPLDYNQQATLDHLKAQNLLILGLNSAWQLDHHYKTRASINTDALSHALTQIRRNPDYKNCLKIAVWHHPLHSPWSDRLTDQGFLEQLAVAGFRLFLHGHIHKAETSLYRYDLSTNGRKLDQICAGTFGAPTQELIPGYPWQYNLLKLEDNQLTVYTRRREEPNGAWKPDARWLQGAGKTSLDYYAIAL